MISSVLQKGLFDLMYFTWLHNSEALAYFAGCILTLFLQFKKPSRTYLLLFIGFLLLLLQFQYLKHIVEPLEQQTLQTVLQQGSQGLRFSRITSIVLNKIIPIGLYLGGWGSIFWAIIKKNSNIEIRNNTK